MYCFHQTNVRKSTASCHVTNQVINVIKSTHKTRPNVVNDTLNSQERNLDLMLHLLRMMLSCCLYWDSSGQIHNCSDCTAAFYMYSSMMNKRQNEQMWAVKFHQVQTRQQTYQLAMRLTILILVLSMETLEKKGERGENIKNEGSARECKKQQSRNTCIT